MSYLRSPKMNVKDSLKNYCIYCKNLLLDPKEIKLHYYFSWNKDMTEYEREDNLILKFLSKALVLSES